MLLLAATCRSTLSSAGSGGGAPTRDPQIPLPCCRWVNSSTHRSLCCVSTYGMCHRDVSLKLMQVEVCTIKTP